MPVGMCVIRTAESVVLTLWPPGPLERKTSTLSSFSGISIESSLSMSGMTSTAAKLVWRRPWLSNGLIRTSRWVPRLDGEVPERVRHVDLEGRRLEAGLLGVGGVHDLRRVAVALGPAQVHPHEHLGEVGGVDATGAGADRDDGLALVVLPRQQGADLELADVLLQGREVALGLVERGGVVLLLAHLDEGLEVLDARVHAERRGRARSWRGTGRW